MPGLMGYLGAFGGDLSGLNQAPALELERNNQAFSQVFNRRNADRSHGLAESQLAASIANNMANRQQEAKLAERNIQATMAMAEADRALKEKLDQSMTAREFSLANQRESGMSSRQGAGFKHDSGMFDKSAGLSTALAQFGEDSQNFRQTQGFKHSENMERSGQNFRRGESALNRTDGLKKLLMNLAMQKYGVDKGAETAKAPLDFAKEKYNSKHGETMRGHEQTLASERIAEIRSAIKARAAQTQNSKDLILLGLIDKELEAAQMDNQFNLQPVTTTDEDGNVTTKPSSTKSNLKDSREKALIKAFGADYMKRFSSKGD